jgi:hypothetical protein
VSTANGCRSHTGFPKKKQFQTDDRPGTYLFDTHTTATSHITRRPDISHKPVSTTGTHPHHARRPDPTALTNASNPRHQHQPTSRQDHRNGTPRNAPTFWCTMPVSPCHSFHPSTCRHQRAVLAQAAGPRTAARSNSRCTPVTLYLHSTDHTVVTESVRHHAAHPNRTAMRALCVRQEPLSAQSSHSQPLRAAGRCSTRHRVPTGRMPLSHHT